MDFLQSHILLPLFIFFARMVDVSMGTIRIIFISKGFKFLSLVIGFVEVLIWLIAINQLWANLNNIWLYIAYAGGFAGGNFVGIWLDEKISIGHATIKIIVRKEASKLINELKKENYPLTVIGCENGKPHEKGKMIFSVVKRSELKKIFNIIKKFHPNAFYTVEDVRSVRKNEYHIIGNRSMVGHDTKISKKHK